MPLGKQNLYINMTIFSNFVNMSSITSLNFGVLLETELWSARLLVDASKPLSSLEDDASKECFRDSDLELAYGSTCCLMLLQWTDDVLSCHYFKKKKKKFTGIKNKIVLNLRNKKETATFRGWIAYSMDLMASALCGHLFWANISN